MTNTTEAPQNIDAFIGKLNTAIDAISEQVIKVAPDAAEMIVGLVQFKGAFDLAVGFLLIVPAIVFAKMFTRKMFGWAVSCGEDQRYSCGEEWAGLIFAHIPFIVLAMVGFCKLLSFNSWLSVLYPEAALAYKALEAVGVSL